MNNKYRYLSKNIVLFAISSFGPKIISFLLVPVYTNFLTTNDYGICDIITSTSSLLIPIFTLCVESAILRFCFDDNYLKEEVFTQSLFVFLIGTLILGAVLVAVLFQPFWKIDGSYIIFLFLIFATHAYYELLTNYARGTERVSIMVEMSLITTAAAGCMNILLLVYFDMGSNGYLISFFSGTAIASVWGSFRLKIRKDIHFEYIQKSRRKELLQYSTPLIFNRIGWWINSVLDRYIITLILGASSNGIYSISYKIPTILTTLSDIFAQAWQLSAIKEYNNEDSKGFISKMYDTYNSYLVLCCAGLVLINIPIAKLLYAKEFFVAWKYVSPLLISFVFGGLSGFLGSIFAAYKDTKVFSISTVLGAVVNMILNFVLVWLMQDAMGAAIATLVSNFVIWITRYVWIRRYIKLSINQFKHSVMYVLIIIMSLIGLSGWNLFSVCIQLAIFAIIVLMNINTYIEILTKILSYLHNKLKRQ